MEEHELLQIGKLDVSGNVPDSISLYRRDGKLFIESTGVVKVEITDEIAFMTGLLRQIMEKR